MRILFVTEYSEIGGGERNLLSVVECFSRLHQVEVWCPGGALAVALEALGVKHRVLPWLNFKRWLGPISLPINSGNASRMAQDFDIIHCYSINVLPLFAMLHEKVIHTIHGHWEKPYGARAKRMLDYFKFACPVSNDVLRQCQIPLERMKLVPLGINLELFSDLERVPRDGVDILCIGRFQQIKGQDLLLEAVLKLKTDKILRIHFIGAVNSSLKEDHQYFEKCRQRAKEIESNSLMIFFHGFQKNILSYLERSDFVVIPSRYESFSIATVESLAAGVPVIGPNVGGVKDIITERVGYFFKAEDVKDLSEKVQLMLENYSNFDERVMRERAKMFSIEEQCQKLKGIYKEVLKS